MWRLVGLGDPEGDLGILGVSRKLGGVCGIGGLGFRVWGFRVWGLGFRAWGLGFRVWGFRVWGLGFGV